MNEFDERYSTAEEAIFDAFFILMKEKDIDRITVSDVVKKAGIVRSTYFDASADEVADILAQVFITGILPGLNPRK